MIRAAYVSAMPGAALPPRAFPEDSAEMPRHSRCALAAVAAIQMLRHAAHPQGPAEPPSPTPRTGHPFRPAAALECECATWHIATRTAGSRVVNAFTKRIKGRCCFKTELLLPNNQISLPRTKSFARPL